MANLDVTDHIDSFPFGTWDAMDLQGRLEQILASPIFGIHFCAMPPDLENVPANGPTNHWLLFLQIANNRSLRVSISSGDEESKEQLGVIALKECNYTFTQNSLSTVSAGVRQVVTTEALFKEMILSGRDKYRFASPEEGCRFWVQTMAADLSRWNLISQETAKEVDERIGYLYERIGNEVVITPRPVEKGVFVVSEMSQ